jgi:hypothetical protein
MMTTCSDEATFTGPRGSGLIDWLSFAAAPTFAVMALLTQSHGRGPLDTLCAGAGSPLSGMTVMYALMAAFHTPPWLRLIARAFRG